MEGTLKKKTKEKKVFGLGSDKRSRYFILDYGNKQFVIKHAHDSSPFDLKNKVTFFKDILKVEETEGSTNQFSFTITTQD